MIWLVGGWLGSGVVVGVALWRAARADDSPHPHHPPLDADAAIWAELDQPASGKCANCRKPTRGDALWCDHVCQTAWENA